MIGDFVNPSLCLHLLREASRNRAVCVRSVGKEFINTPQAVLDCLADLALAGVIECRVVPDVPGFLSLSLGGKALQAIFLFALNFDFPDDSPVGGCSSDAGSESIVAVVSAQLEGVAQVSLVGSGA